MDACEARGRSSCEGCTAEAIEAEGQVPAASSSVKPAAARSVEVVEAGPGKATAEGPVEGPVEAKPAKKKPGKGVAEGTASLDNVEAADDAEDTEKAVDTPLVCKS